MCRWHIFCGDIFRASLTVGWSVVSADASWQLRWSQAFVGGVSLENSHHCLLDGQHKGPKWLRATGCVWVFVYSANLCVCVCRFAASYKSVNCNSGTDVGSQLLTVCGFSIWELRCIETWLKWLTSFVKTQTDVEAHVTYLSRCCLMYGIPSHIRKNRLTKIYN